MNIQRLADLNKLRSGSHYKDEQEEGFLTSLNHYLFRKEVAEYNDYEQEHPFLFVYGLPRSGTTLLAQLLTQGMDVGYINNFMARFWLAPVTGIKLSRQILGEKKESDFQSAYATTSGLHDIHEFGYFWRYWLKKDAIEDHVKLEENEKKADWQGLRKVLLNIQQELNAPVCMKNIFGSFHIQQFTNMLDKVLFICIERDPVDNAISILEARKQFFSDLNLWWSIIPPEYEKLKDLPYIDQIAGQVYYLRKFYQDQEEKLGKRHIVKITYRELCQSPASIPEKINEKLHALWNDSVPTRAVPDHFPMRTYEDKQLRDTFAKALQKFEP